MLVQKLVVQESSYLHFAELLRYCGFVELKQKIRAEAVAGRGSIGRFLPDSRPPRFAAGAGCRRWLRLARR